MDLEPNSASDIRTRRSRACSLIRPFLPSGNLANRTTVPTPFQDIGRLLSLAASSASLLTLPQTDGPDDGLPQGEERSEQFVLEVSEYFERLDVSPRPPSSCSLLAHNHRWTSLYRSPSVRHSHTYDSLASPPPRSTRHPRGSFPHRWV